VKHYAASLLSASAHARGTGGTASYLAVHRTTARYLLVTCDCSSSHTELKRCQIKGRWRPTSPMLLRVRPPAFAFRVRVFCRIRIPCPSDQCVFADMLDEVIQGAVAVSRRIFDLLTDIGKPFCLPMPSRFGASCHFACPEPGRDRLPALILCCLERLQIARDCL
jgi:hypothetical protein